MCAQILLWRDVCFTTAEERAGIPGNIMTLCKRGPLGYFVLYQDDTHAAASKNNFRTTFFYPFSDAFCFCSRHRKSLISYHLQKQSNLNTCFPFEFFALLLHKWPKSHLMIFGTKSKGRRSRRILKIGYKEIGTKVCFFFCDFFFF